MKNKGLTLTEIMITVAIIGILAAIAIPAISNFTDDAKRNICLQNLKVVDGVKIQWAMENNQPDSSEPTASDLDAYIKGDFPQPIIAGALYKIGNIVTPALCSFHGNYLTNGLGLTVPNGISELVSSGQVDSSDIIGNDWSWENRSHGFGPSYAYFGIDDSSTGQWEWTEMDTDVQPEISVGGNTLTTDNGCIFHHSKESVEATYGGYEGDQYDYIWMSQMTEGGYVVENTDADLNMRTDYYNHEGELMGSKVMSTDIRYYDSEGNLLLITQ